MLKPLGDKLIIQIIEEEEKKSGSILLPSSAKERPQEGKVIAIGNGLIAADGKRVPLTVAVGDVVIFSKYAGTEVKYEGQSYLILRESDILVIV